MSKQGIRVVMVCAGINLMLGVLFSWHVAKTALLAALVQTGATSWAPAALDDIYRVLCLTFAFSMLFAGRLQDEIGPRTATFFGAVLICLGFVLVALATSYAAWFVGFGVFGGLGLGVIYATTTPTALRWVPRSRSGLIAGAVVATSGLAALWVIPLANWLIAVGDVREMMLILGAGFLVVVAILAQLLAVPSTRPALFANVADDGLGIVRMTRLPQVRWLWLTYFAGAGAAFMMAGFLTDLATRCLGDAVYAAAVALAVGGAGGRLALGAMSDRLGRERTLRVMLATQSVLTLVAGLVGMAASPPAAVVLLLIGLISFTYGGMLALYPAIIRDRFGLRNFGQNYGLIFTGWGVGGFVMSGVGEFLHGATGSHLATSFLASVLLLAGYGVSRRLTPASLPTQNGAACGPDSTRSETVVVPSADSM